MISPKPIPTAWSVDTISLTYSFTSHNHETHFAFSFDAHKANNFILWKERETQRVYLKGSLKCAFEPKYPPASNSTIREPFGWVFKNWFLFFFYQSYPAKNKYLVRTKISIYVTGEHSLTILFHPRNLDSPFHNISLCLSEHNNLLIL